MRRSLAGALALAALAGSGASACGGDDPSSPRSAATANDDEALAETLQDYATDANVRRRALEVSLVRNDNAYARLRLERYATVWAELPELDPRTTPIRLGDVERGSPAPDAYWSAVDAGATGWMHAELRALGERAFYNYPVEIAPTVPTALRAPDRAGIWEHEGRFGVVWARLADDRVMPAFTCATCHASVDRGRLVAGKNNANIDLGRINGDGERGFGWRRGTVDVTGDGVDDPVAITDLRPLRWQLNLHHAATLRNDPVALSIRMETLVITRHHETIRPPRKIIAGLTAFLLGLAPKEPLPHSAPGAGVFARECRGCHRGDGASGPAVALDAAGTDPLVGQSKDRGTGSYRVPSLRSVGDRRRLFASGAIEDIDDLLTPSPGRRAKGHLYGLSLDAEDRAALLDFLRAL